MRVRPWLLVVFAVTMLIGLPIACGYLHLPGGWIVNFPGFGGRAIPEAQLNDRLRAPEGFSVNTYVGGIENARLLRFTPA
ncbi:MAG: hypothetical protein U0802_18795, partial [Candidatus Binatia bacterium]